MEKMENVAELKVGFPRNLFFKEIIFIDDHTHTGVDLMRKYAVKYFKLIQVRSHPDIPNTIMVIARVKKRETEKWKKIFKDLWILCPGENYRKACRSLYQIIEENKNKLERM